MGFDNPAGHGADAYGKLRIDGQGRRLIEDVRSDSQFIPFFRQGEITFTAAEIVSVGVTGSEPCRCCCLSGPGRPLEPFPYVGIGA